MISTAKIVILLVRLIIFEWWKSWYSRKFIYFLTMRYAPVHPMLQSLKCSTVPLFLNQLGTGPVRKIRPTSLPTPRKKVNLFPSDPTILANSIEKNRHLWCTHIQSYSYLIIESVLKSFITNRKSHHHSPRWPLLGSADLQRIDQCLRPHGRFRLDLRNHWVVIRKMRIQPAWDLSISKRYLYIYIFIYLYIYIYIYNQCKTVCWNR